MRFFLVTQVVLHLYCRLASFSWTIWVTRCSVLVCVYSRYLINWLIRPDCSGSMALCPHECQASSHQPIRFLCCSGGPATLSELESMMTSSISLSRSYYFDNFMLEAPKNLLLLNSRTRRTNMFVSLSRLLTHNL